MNIVTNRNLITSILKIDRKNKEPHRIHEVELPDEERAFLEAHQMNDLFYYDNRIPYRVCENLIKWFCDVYGFVSESSGSKLASLLDGDLITSSEGVYSASYSFNIQSRISKSVKDKVTVIIHYSIKREGSNLHMLSQRNSLRFKLKTDNWSSDWMYLRWVSWASLGDDLSYTEGDKVRDEHFMELLRAYDALSFAVGAVKLESSRPLAKPKKAILFGLR